MVIRCDNYSGVGWVCECHGRRPLDRSTSMQMRWRGNALRCL